MTGLKVQKEILAKKMSKRRVKHNTPMQTTTLQDTLNFINEWLEHGDVQKACAKHKVDKSTASKMLKGKIGPRFDFLKELKERALKNHAKIMIHQ
jgi:phage terminase large subunit